MSYQPPGPYPVFPQYPGAAVMPTAKPPRPATVLRAHYCILAGAVLTLVSAGITIANSGTLKSSFQQNLPTTTDGSVVTSLGNAVIVIVCVIAALEAGLWVWMAFATKAGHNWARILCTVFFGLQASGQLIGAVSFATLSSTGDADSNFSDSASTTVPSEIVGWLTFAVGFAAIILLWNKAAGPYFKPLTFYPAPYGYPGAPMPYTYPVMPGQPMPQGQPVQPQDAAAGQQPPTDPWNTTPPSD